jgi:ABC-type nitrate/sulfonate/bicarbonate transport system substrate-binding protein
VETSDVAFSRQFSATARRVGIAFRGGLVGRCRTSADKIITGMVAHGPPQWPQYIATELGWLKQDNIELTSSPWRGGGAQQLAAGALISPTAATRISRARRCRAPPVKIIINDIVASPYAVFAKPNIKQIADLKGK